VYFSCLSFFPLSLSFLETPKCICTKPTHRVSILFTQESCKRLSRKKQIMGDTNQSQSFHTNPPTSTQKTIPPCNRPQKNTYQKIIAQHNEQFCYINKGKEPSKLLQYANGPTNQARYSNTKTPSEQIHKCFHKTQGTSYAISQQ
jgi:hypothetical protein